MRNRSVEKYLKYKEDKDLLFKKTNNYDEYIKLCDEANVFTISRSKFDKYHNNTTKKSGAVQPALF